MIGFAASAEVYSEWLASLLEDGEAVFPEVRGKAQARALMAGGAVLTVPVAGGSGVLKRARVRYANQERDEGDGCGELMISDHGRWREVHLGSLKAIYGKAPYFPYLFPEVERIYRERSHGRLGDFTEALHDLACDWLGVRDDGVMASLREARRIEPGLLERLAKERRRGEYSIFDLLFRLGRESLFALL